MGCQLRRFTSASMPYRLAWHDDSTGWDGTGINGGLHINGGPRTLLGVLMHAWAVGKELATWTAWFGGSTALFVLLVACRRCSPWGPGLWRMVELPREFSVAHP